MSSILRVLLLEDDAADADLAVATLRQAGMQVDAKRVDTSETFRAALEDFEPDVVVCDHGLGQFDTATVLPMLRRSRPATPLIVLSGALDEHDIVSTIHAGADDVLLKEHLARLPHAVSSALERRALLRTLTPRQLEVLQLIAQGHTTPEIARRLDLSAKTVDTHRTEIMKRLGKHDLAALVRYSVSLGLVRADA
jgi:DNA-binding NarL/FixJ family response regulator